MASSSCGAIHLLFFAIFALPKHAVFALPSVSAQASVFYSQPKTSVFYKMAIKVGTDKQTDHNYDVLYSKYFEIDGRRLMKLKVLEIGLGCDMGYGPGQSAILWKHYFPSSVIWFAEFDAKCVEAHREKLNTMGIKVVVGDQRNISTLTSWVNITQGGFDVIIDDGGHTSLQQFNSFIVLFLQALKPGGVYFIEDLHVAGVDQFVDGDHQHYMDAVLTDWAMALLNSDGRQRSGYHQRFRMPPGIRTIEFGPKMAAIVKCFDDDGLCNFYEADNGMLTYTQEDEIVLPSPPVYSHASPPPPGCQSACPTSLSLTWTTGSIVMVVSVAVVAVLRSRML